VSLGLVLKEKAHNLRHGRVYFPYILHQMLVIFMFGMLEPETCKELPVQKRYMYQTTCSLQLNISKFKLFILNPDLCFELANKCQKLSEAVDVNFPYMAKLLGF
jgi:hypothetical protein